MVMLWMLGVGLYTVTVMWAYGVFEQLDFKSVRKKDASVLLSEVELFAISVVWPITTVVLVGIGIWGTIKKVHNRSKAGE